MGAGEELRGGKGITKQDILQEKNTKEKQLSQNLQLGWRQRYISNIQEAREKGQRLKIKHYCAQLYHLVTVVGNCI